MEASMETVGIGGLRSGWFFSFQLRTADYARQGSRNVPERSLSMQRLIVYVHGDGEHPLLP